jgi:inhibitor of cysteine peptidase
MGNVTREGIVTNVSDPFSIRLDANPTTGYQWELAAPFDENVLHHEGTDFEPSDQARQGLVGAGGRSVWTFDALCVGWTVVHLRYRRPWEPADDATDRQAIYTVVVR